ncbi:uncharacterized protein PFL1_06100 [Pseudozyma flocculosa PF-1]|uniref:Uncharacterized protein n=1 Tax=Pseudozyma flocculosa PF-1 TaxID=1277687 RepID=A0A061H1G8_9BASI|nr:uncharacterized protein PFL1_06100 [Pseudozyma flocculosa PF-1]EPQ26452.1 hypothetical protein PFL1_06100 [Pseudozyma flocculosa PF-1]
MNGLMLPTGSKPPLTGDTATSDRGLATSPSAQVKPEIGFGAAAPGQPSPSAHPAPHRKLSASPPHSGRIVSGGGAGAGARSAASLAFIPRTFRSSAGIRKPLSRCSEFELADMLDRNERILSTPLPTVPAQEPATPAAHARREAQSRARERLRKETDDIRRELLAKRGVRQIQEDMSQWHVDGRAAGAMSKEALAAAMGKLSVRADRPSASSDLACSSSSNDGGHVACNDSLAWQRDTVGVKKRLAEEVPTFHGLRLQETLALESAALVAEMDRERRAEEVRSTNGRERTVANSLPAGPAHRLGRKSVSSASNTFRRGSGSPIFSGGVGIKAEEGSDEEVGDNDGDDDDAEEQRRTVSPSDFFEDGDGDGAGGEGEGELYEEMVFEDEFE